MHETYKTTYIDQAKVRTSYLDGWRKLLVAWEREREVSGTKQSSCVCEEKHLPLVLVALAIAQGLSSCVAFEQRAVFLCMYYNFNYTQKIILYADIGEERGRNRIKEIIGES